MKLITMLLLIAVALTTKSQNKPVIVELFTSQGCSSCPSADKNLTELLKQYSDQGKPVFGLSFHVDYWNYLGWKDPYSSKDFTARQRQYAQQLNLNSVYTPQMVVNGQTEFVGSNKAAAVRAIEAQLKANQKYYLSIHDVKWQGNSINIDYTLDQLPANCHLNIAVVEKGVENQIPAGENSGRKLHHNNVVRAFQTSSPKLSDNVGVTMSKPNKSNFTVIIYLQDSEMNVLAASSKSIDL